MNDLTRFGLLVFGVVYFAAEIAVIGTLVAGVIIFPWGIKPRVVRVAQALTQPSPTLPAPTRTPRPTFTPLPTPTFVPTFTPTTMPSPSPTDVPTSTPKKAATATRTKTPAPAPTKAPPAFQYEFDRNVIIRNPNCEHPFFEGRVVDASGAGIGGVIIEARWFDNVAFNISGRNRSEDAFDKWGFAPLSTEYYHATIPFEFRVVSSTGPDRQVLSDVLRIDKPDCAQTGQFTNIVVRQR